MAAWTVDVHSVFFWLLIAGLFAGCAAGFALRRMKRRSGKRGVGVLFSLSGVCAAFLGAFLFSEIDQVVWGGSHAVISAAAVAAGAGSGFFGRQAVMPLLLVAVIFCAGAAMALEGLLYVPGDGELAEVRVLSMGEEASTIECRTLYSGGDLTVARLSGKGIVAEADLYRRSDWFFLARQGPLYGNLVLRTADEEDDLACRTVPPVHSALLHAGVQAGLLKRERVSAVRERTELLSSHTLVNSAEGIVWRKTSQ